MDIRRDPVITIITIGSLDIRDYNLFEFVYYHLSVHSSNVFQFLIIQKFLSSTDV